MTQNWAENEEQEIATTNRLTERSQNTPYAQQRLPSKEYFTSGEDHAQPRVLGSFTNYETREESPQDDGDKKVLSNLHTQAGTREQTPIVYQDITQLDAGTPHVLSSGVRTNGGYTSAGSPDSYMHQPQRKPLGTINLNTSTPRRNFESPEGPYGDQPKHYNSNYHSNNHRASLRLSPTDYNPQPQTNKENQSLHTAAPDHHQAGSSRDQKVYQAPDTVGRGSNRIFDNGSASSAERYFLRHDSKSKERVLDVPTSLAQSFGIADELHRSPPGSAGRPDSKFVAAIRCSPVTIRDPLLDGCSFHSLNAGPPTSRYGPVSSHTVPIADSIGLDTNGNLQGMPNFDRYGSENAPHTTSEQYQNQKRYASMQIHQERQQKEVSVNSHHTDTYTHQPQQNREGSHNSAQNQPKHEHTADEHQPSPTSHNRRSQAAADESSAYGSREKNAVVKSIRLKSLQKLDTEERSKSPSHHPSLVLQSVLSMVRQQNSRRTSLKGSTLPPEEHPPVQLESRPDLTVLQPVKGFGQTQEISNGYGSPRMILGSRGNRANTSASVAQNDSEMEDKTQASQMFVTSPYVPIQAEFSASTGMKQGGRPYSNTKVSKHSAGDGHKHLKPLGSIAEALNGLQTESLNSQGESKQKGSLLRSPELNQFMMTATLTSNNTEKEARKKSTVRKETSVSAKSASKSKKSKQSKANSKNKKAKTKKEKDDTEAAGEVKSKKKLKPSPKPSKKKVGLETEESEARVSVKKVIAKKLKKLKEGSKSRSGRSKSRKSGGSKANSASSVIVMVRPKRLLSSADLKSFAAQNRTKTRTQEMSSTLRSTTPKKAGVSPSKSASLGRSRSKSLRKLNLTETFKRTPKKGIQALLVQTSKPSIQNKKEEASTSVVSALNKSTKVKTARPEESKKKVKKIETKDMSVRELKPSTSYDKYYQEKNRVLQQSQKKQNRVIGSIVDLFMQRHREAEKRRKLVERLEKSISLEKQILNKSSELSKQHISNELMKSLEAQSQRILNKTDPAVGNSGPYMQGRLSGSKTQSQISRLSHSQSLLISGKLLPGAPYNPAN